MAVFRVHKNKDYTTVSNTHLRDKSLSLKAKGMLTMMLSFSDDWNYSISGLVAICKEGRSAVEATLKELKEHGYLEVEKLPPEKGKRGTFEYVYNIYEVPTSITKLDAGNVCVENDAQLNTNKSIQNESGNGVEAEKESESIKDCKPNTKKNKRFQKPTIEQIKEYATERGYPNFDAEYFWDYWESRGWRRGGDTIKDWKAAFRNWVKRNKNQNQPSEDIYDNEYADVW